MNIEIHTMSGKRLACYVDGKRVFHMPKSKHKLFYARVERLRAQDRVNAFHSQMRTVLAIIDTHRLAVTDCGGGVYIEPVPSAVQNQAAASIARLEGSIERNRQIDEKLIPWIEAGMPVPISSVPLFGGFAHE